MTKDEMGRIHSTPWKIANALCLNYFGQKAPRENTTWEIERQGWVDTDKIYLIGNRYIIDSWIRLAQGKIHGDRNHEPISIG
jgi:hypothetical protein